MTEDDSAEREERDRARSRNHADEQPFHGRPAIILPALAAASAGESRSLKRPRQIT